MESEYWIDETNNVVCAQFTGMFTLADGPELLKNVRKLFEGREARLLLIDLSLATDQVLSKELRQWLKENSPQLEVDKVAVTGASALIRIAARIVIATMGRAKDTGFFKTNDEALAWLKDGKR